MTAVRFVTRLATDFGKKVVAAAVTFLMVVWGLPAVLNTSAAHASPTPDADVSAISTGLQSLCDLTKGLAADGAFAQTLPLLNLVPGGDSGFGFSDACQSSVIAQLNSALNSTTNPLLHCSQLASSLTNSALSLTNSRSAALTIGNVVCGAATSGSVTGTPDQIPLDLTLDRTVSPGLNISGSGNGSPISVTSDNGVTAILHLDLSLTLGYDWDKNFFYLVDNSTTKPTLSATATISIPNTTHINAGIGILKADLTGSLGGTISFGATMSDPTGSGQLGFTLGSGGAGNTALANAQLGSVFNVAVGGSLSGSMSVAPVAIGATTFPTASFDVSWTDVTNPGTLSFTNLTNFSGVLSNFQNLTPRNLADGLGQLVQTIRGVEAANNGVNLNVNLPFMKGSLSDATKIEESLADFLTKHVSTTAPATQPQGTSSNTTYELPDFTSIQDLVTELTKYSPSTGSAAGSLLNATGVTYDQTNNKLSLTLSLSRSSPTSVSLDAGAQVADSDATASNVAYGGGTSGTLTDNTKTWTTNQWAGFQVITLDKLHNGTVLSNTSHTITLQGAWIGGTPSNTGFSIESQDPKTGMVDFGTLSSASSGAGKNFLLNANATVPEATISPTYTAQVTLVLDLEPAVTGSGCETFYYNPVENPGNQACPFVPSGGGTVVNSLPTAPDRIMLRTADSTHSSGLPLFSFDAPVDTKVSIDASVGFLSVHLDGTLKECTTETGTADCSGTADSGKNLIDVTLKPQADSAHQFDIPLDQVFSDLTSGPSSLLDASVNGQAYACVDVSVPDAGQIFGSSGTKCDGTTASGTARMTVTMADITKPTDVSVDTSQLSSLLDFNFDPSNPQALFGALVKGLQVLLQTLQDTPGAASSNSALQTALTTTIPGVNRSLKDILAGGEGGTGKDVTYGTSSGVGTITDGGNKNWTTDQFKGRSVVVGTNMMTVASNTSDTLTLTSAWPGTQPADGSPYLISNELEAALSQLTANPGNTLQSVVNVLNQLMGTNAVKFSVNNSNSTDGPMLEMDIDWNRSYSTEAPIGFDLSKVSSIPSQLTSIVGVQAQGVTTLNAGAEIKLGLLLPLSTNTSNPCYLPTSMDASSLLNTLCITSDSKISASVNGSVSGNVQVTVGPVAVALGNPSDSSQNAQAKATLSVGLGDSTSPSGTVESIGSFLGNVSPSFNSGTPVSCGDPGVTDPSDKLAVCAVLPLFVKNGSTWNPVCSASSPANCPTPDELFLRLPQSSDPSTTFNLNGTLQDGTTPTFGTTPDLAQIGTDLANQILDLNALNGGIDGYFQFAENALNLASDNGKLPLVGNDLQEGSAFLTNLQATFDSVMGSLGSANNVKAVEDFANTTLQNALNGAGVLPSGSKVTVAVTCSSSGQLSSPTPTAVATNPDTGTTDYAYEIVASTSDGNAPVGSASSTVQNVDPSKLGSTDYNTVTWTAASNVTYAVFRSVGGGTYYQVASGLTTGTFTDNITSTSGAAVPSGGSPCDPNAGISGINGVTLEMSIGQGTVSSANGCTDAVGSPCIAGGVGGNGVPFNIGVPGLSFSAAGSTSQNLLSVKVGWGLHLKFGIDTTHGFFICTGEVNSSATPCATSTGFAPLGVGLAFTLPAQMKLNIAFLQMCVANHPVPTSTDPCSDTTAPSTPAFAGAFTIQLNSPNKDGMITGADLANGDLSSLVTPQLSAAVNLDWDFLVDTSAGPALPGLGGEFKFAWSWSSASPDSGTPTTLEFDNVYIDAGAFLSGVLGSVLNQVNEILNPIRPVINVLEAPIPVLSDLSEAIGGPPVTLLSIAEAFSTLAGGPDLTAINEVVKVVQFVADLANQIATIQSGSPIHIPLGSFKILGAAAKDTTATPDNADQLVDTSSLQSCDPNPLPGTGTTSSGCGSGNGTFDQLNSHAGSLTSDNNVTDSGQSNQHYGFEFTALQHPATLLSVLMGKDVELFAFDSGPLTLAFSYNQAFGPVYAPPPVLVVISGSASISARIRIGFDTKGIREAVDAANSGGGAGGVLSGILDGLYISTTDPTTGQPIPAITLTGTLAAGAEVSVVFLSVGIEGGITLTINLLWNDPDNDGKLRFSEFLAGLHNPLCLFNFSGSLSAFIKLFIDIGFSPFDFSFSFDLVNVTLLDFSTNNSCAASPDPPILGKVQGGVLYVYAGKLGTGEFRDVSSQDHWGNDEQFSGDEKFLVTELHDPNTHNFSGVSIDWSGHHQDFLDTSIKTVYIDAQNYGGKETFTLGGDKNTATQDAPFDRSAIIIGGNKDDVISVSDSCPNATACTDTPGAVYVDGGAGDDQINVGDANAIVAGGPGANQVQVGNGDDWVDGNGGDIGTGFGNSALTFSTTSYGSKTIIDPSKPIGHTNTWSQSSGDGNDNVHVGLGADTVWGGAGDNTISVAKDSPLSTLPSTNSKYCVTPGICISKGDTIIGGGGMNHIAGGSGNDTIWAGQYADPGGDPADNWQGVSGDHYDNVTIGATVDPSGNIVRTGNTTVYGGSAGNFVQGNSIPGKTDTIYGGSGDDTLIGGNGNDKVYGEGGNNVIIGGTGSSLLVGGSGDDYIVAGGGDVEPRTGVGGNAVNAQGQPFYGSPGPVHVDSNNVPIRTVTLPPPGTTIDGHNTIIGNGGSNHIWGGNGGDTIYGHYQDETCAAPAPGSPPYAVQYHEDHAVGEGTSFDFIYGGNGDNTISGGGGTNFIQTGTGNDLVCAGTGNDTVIGQSTPATVDKIYGIAGRNLIYGGQGDDQLFGGTDDDTIYAGSGNTYIEGGGGANVIYAGGGNDAIIGGTSTAATLHNPDTLSPPGPTGGRLFGGTGVSVIVGDNGCVDMTAVGPEVSFPGQAVTVNSCDPSATPNSLGQALQVFDLDSGTTNPLNSPKFSENNYIVGGQGPSMAFGGLGSNTILGGSSDNYIEGGTGPNYIQGGSGGNNDVIGGSSPNYLPVGTCTGGSNPASTSCIPANSNIIYGDDGTGGATCGCTDGSNAIVADNGSITRVNVFPGWQASALKSNLIKWGDGSTVPNRMITNLDIYNGDMQGAASWLFAGTGHDFLFGGPGGDSIYGGPPIAKQPIGTTGSQLCPSAPTPCVNPSGSYGNDYIEGGPGHPFIETGGGQNDMIGGVSPFHLATGQTTTNVPNTGSTMYGGNGDNYLVADNGEIDHQCGSPGNPTLLACSTTSTPWTVDPNDLSFFRQVTLWDLPVIGGAVGVGGNSELHTGNGFDHAYGGKGNNKLLGGASDDYLMGGTGNNCITGSAGSNDIIGGTAPEVLPNGLTTAKIPSGSNVIYDDMVDGSTNSCLTGTPGGASAGPDDGTNVVIGNNGDITRQHDTGGSWIRSSNDPTDPGVILRNITNLDIYTYPLASEPGTKDVIGSSDVIFGGTRDDILLGGPAGNTIFAGPPSAVGSILDTTTGNHFDNTQNYGNKHIEGGPGVNAIFGSGGDDDIIGGVSPFYLAAGHDTGTVGSLDTAPTAHAGNLLVGGTGNDYIAGANAQIDHLCGSLPTLHVCAPVDLAHWASNTNDKGGAAGPSGATIRQIQLLNLTTASGPTGAITRGIGSDNRIYGTAGDNHLYGENSDNSIQGGSGNDYIEGGTGNNLIQGGGGDKDIVGGTSPASLTSQGSVAANDAYVANHIPSGNDIICSFVCGRKMVPGSTTDPLVNGDTTNDSVIVGHNGRIDRCPAASVSNVTTPQGSDVCTWQRTNYGNEKVSSYFNSAAVTGVAQTGQVCTAVGPGCPVVSLGDPRTRFTTLLGQSPSETIQTGTDYMEGNIGNNSFYGEDGPAVIHAVTPRPDATGAIPSAWFPQYAEFGSTFLLSNECLPNPAYNSVYNQNIIVGGYGGVGVGKNLQDLKNGFGSNDVLCGGNGDDAILGSRGLVGVLNKTGPNAGAVTPVPFSNTPTAATTIGATGGPPYGTLTVPGSGNTIYPVRLDVEYVDGALVQVPNSSNPAATHQVNQHDIIFGGGGNNTIHGSPGADFIEGGYGMHLLGTPVPCAAVPPTPTAPPSGCAPSGDNIIFGGQGNGSVEGGPGNSDIFGGPGNKDLDVNRTDIAMAPKVDNAGNCMPLAFPTITKDPSTLGVANGYCAPNPSFPAYQWANQSYASRFPAPTAGNYDYDIAGRDNGGTTSHTFVFGHVIVSGMDRDIDQAQGFGDRMIGPNGSYNLFFVCPAAYGGFQIIRALKPALLSFEQQLAALDGAYNVNQTSKAPSTPSSGDAEIELVYSSSGNSGSAYPTTAGHFTC